MSKKETLWLFSRVEPVFNFDHMQVKNRPIFSETLIACLPGILNSWKSRYRPWRAWERALYFLIST